MSGRDFLMDRLVDEVARGAGFQTAAAFYSGQSTTDDDRTSSESDGGSDHGHERAHTPPAVSTDEHAKVSAVLTGLMSQHQQQQQQQALLLQTLAAFGGGGAAATNMFGVSPLHYAATLASLSQQLNMLSQQQAPPSAAPPLLYPHLYQSLMGFPNLEQLRQALNSPQKSPTTATSTVGGVGRLLQPETNPAKTLAASPSPRKRAVAAVSSGSESGRSSAKKSPEKELQRHQQSDVKTSPLKRLKAIKRLQFEDDETHSPVSGMFIRKADDVKPTDELQAEADLDDSAQFVEITEQAREELSKIPNVIGDYRCSLCKVKYEDAFRLAQHRCPRIAHEEYKCPECDKVFSCPANLASHRRWHKPSQNNQSKSSASEPATGVLFDEQPLVGFRCEQCGKRFDSHLMLRTHAITHTEFAAAAALTSPTQSFTPGWTNASRIEVQCPQRDCDFWFVDGIALERHLVAVHADEQRKVTSAPLKEEELDTVSAGSTFDCRFCGRRLTTSPALTRHINKHHANVEQRLLMLKEIGCK